MPDVAVLGIKVENGEVVKATTSLEGLAVAGAKTEAATQRLTRRMALAEIAAREMDAELGRTGRAMVLLETEARKMDAEMGQAARAMALTEIEARKMDAALGRTGSTMVLLEVEARKMDAEFERSRRAMALVEIEARKMDAGLSGLAQGSRYATREMALMEIEARKLDKTMGAHGQTLTRLKGVLSSVQPALAAMGVVMGAAAVGMAVREIIALTNAYTGLSNKLRLVTVDAENREAVERALFDASQRTRSELEGNVTLYSSLARSTKALGLSQAELVTITETVSGAMSVGGASASEQASSIRQLSQAFASGVLRGDEFNSMAENAPRLQELLAKSLGVSIGQLRAMAEQGLLTSDVLAKAFLDGSGTVKAEVEGMALSIEGAMTKIENAVLHYVGSADAANGASHSIADALSGLADNIPTLLGWWGKLIETMLMYWKVVLAVGTATKNIFTGNAGANADVFADLKAEWDKLLTAPNSGPAAGVVSTKRGSAAGIGQTAADLAKAERERKAAEREAEQARKKEEREATTAQKKAEDYAKDLKDIWDRGMEDIVASTDRGFRAVLDSMQSLIGNMLARMAREGQTNPMLEKASAAIGGGIAGYQAGQSVYSTSHGAAGNYARGALSGAASGAATGFMIAGPVGAAVGAVAGFVGGIVGVSGAAKEAQKHMEELQKTLATNMAALRATVSRDTVAQGIAQINAERETLRRQIEDAYPGGGSGSEQVARRNAALREMNALEDRRIQQLKDEYALAQQRGAEDLQVRLLVAQGHTKEAEALRFQLAQQREMQDLVHSFGDVIDPTESATQALLAQVHAQEKLKTATDAANTAALNMVQGYKYQSLIFAAMSPRGAQISGPSSSPMFSSGFSSGASTSALSGDLTVKLVLSDGSAIGKVVIKDFARRKQRGDAELEHVLS